MIPSNFSCSCGKKKRHRLVFDGGILGTYKLELCNSCYFSQDKKFLISEETLHEETN